MYMYVYCMPLYVDIFIEGKMSSNLLHIFVEMKKRRFLSKISNGPFLDIVLGLRFYSSDVYKIDYIFCITDTFICEGTIYIICLYIYIYRCFN